MVAPVVARSSIVAAKVAAVVLRIAVVDIVGITWLGLGGSASAGFLLVEVGCVPDTTVVVQFADGVLLAYASIGFAI